MPNDLDFRGAWKSPSGGAVALDFGNKGSTTVQAVTAKLSTKLPPPKANLKFGYAHRVSRHLEGSSQFGWQVTKSAKPVTRDSWSDTARQRVSGALNWSKSHRLVEQMAMPVADLRRTREVDRLVWEGAVPLNALVGEGFESLVRHHQASLEAWQAAQQVATGVTECFVWLIPLLVKRGLEWGKSIPFPIQRCFEFAPGQARCVFHDLPWANGRHPLPGESVWVEPPNPPPPVERVGPIALDFRCPLLGARLQLRFAQHPCPGRVYAIPVLKVYFVSNQVEVVRLPGREPIPVKNVQIGIDVDSWAWGFSAALPGSAQELIEPTAEGPVEIEIRINGVVWVMLVEAFDLRREFGSSQIAVRGRSLAAWLAEPYAPKRTFSPSVPFTARQLAENQLLRPGLATGFALDWQIADWLVPGGAVSFEAMSPVGVINRIAQSAGGFVNVHPYLKQLAVKPRYPALPWQWGNLTPDTWLPLDVVKTLNLRWQEKPAYNAVTVCGEQAGIVAQVKRAGTAGDLPAAMVVDSLITHVDAARARGTAILADTGRQALVTLELPMLPELGLLAPGLLLGVGAGASAWRGLVRSTQVSAQWAESLSVRQSIEVERHYL